VAALPADPAATIRLWASVGPACCAVMLPAAIVRRRPQPVAIVPEALNDPVLWRAASACARQGEQSGDDAAAAITAARAVFGPVEASAWDEAAELTDRGADGDAWVAAAHRWSANALEAARQLPA
jgi:hypothetical protein